jgi:hypothetical protein
VAHGGQVLLTEPARHALEGSREVRDLGHHRLKDLSVPEHLFQLLGPGLERDFPPLRSLNRSNLPAPATPLVGRSVEVSDAVARLARPDVRLLTLLGPGGAGKTRLAIDAAGEAAGRYRDGVWLVLLAPLLDPGLMLSEIARVLEIDAVSGQPLERAVAGALAGRELLLVLDNFEHLLDAAGVVAEILAGAPGLDVLATSREPLRITGEHRVDVPPLPPGDARELFGQRALAVRPDLVLDGPEAGAVERICARLDGLPLALELAAARVSVFSASALEWRRGWPKGCLCLSGRGICRSASGRCGRRSTGATGCWTGRSRGCLPVCRLSSAVSGSTLPNRSVTPARPTLSSRSPRACYAVARTPTASLGSGCSSSSGNTRSRSLSRTGAAAAAAAAAADRHARSHFRLTEEARPNLIGPDQRRWLDRLEWDHANLQAALERLTEHAPDQALRVASTLTWFWDIRGYQPEASRRLAEALARAPADSPSRGDGLHCAGWMAWNQGMPRRRSRCCTKLSRC